ncbi:unnamed protein product [Moneuplotes crassus]|uniref:Glutathione S-transferase n=1 Tax=Euplotes crassus TaxID=5936 RepID=A0AAD2D4W3_EUPCR|nr:unnamed protein product [Moneuplotes crassus]
MESTPVKLYVDDGSQPSRACMIFCEMNNIPYEKVETRILKAQHKTEEFKKINPLGQVPVLQDGEHYFRESHAILKYLHSTRNCPDHWYPSDAIKRARVDELLDWHHCFLRQGAGNTVFKTLFGPKIGMKFSEGEIEWHKTILSYSLHMLDSKFLGNHKFLLSDELTIADLSIFCELTSLGFLSMDFSEYPNIKTWYSAIDSIEEVSKVCKPVKKFIKMFNNQLKAKI